MTGSKELDVRIWRGGEDGRYERYRVPFRESQTVLDVVTWVQRNVDATLAYRFACRVGMCGSCAMTVNGSPRWTCRSHVSTVVEDGRITIGPLRNLPVIRDLACDMSEFFERWQGARGRFAPSATRADGFAPISPDSPERRAVEAGIECINCAVCYAACDVVASRRQYLGPAALNRAWTLVNDVRDAERDERLRAVSRVDGCHNCHSHQSCAEHCPKAINPTVGIAGLKRESVRLVWRRSSPRSE